MSDAKFVVLEKEMKFCNREAAKIKKETQYLT